MGSFGNAWEMKLLEVSVGKTALTTPTAYVALCTAAPTDASTGATITEPSGNNYSRKSTAGTDWGSASSGDPSTIANSAIITFATASGSWGTCTHFALVDSASGAGNVIGWGALGSSVAPGAGGVASFAAGQLTLTLD